MTQRNLVSLVLFLGTCYLSLGTGERDTTSSPPTKPPLLVTPVSPIGSVISAIGGERVRVEVLLEQGEDPHHIDLPPQRAAHLSEADLYIAAGLDIDRFLLERFGGKGRVVSTFLDLRTGEDPHHWLVPAYLRLLASAIASALSEIDPAGEDLYRHNLKGFEEALAALHEEVSLRLSPHKGKRFYVYHPAFGDFAKAYRLVQVAFEEEGKEPRPQNVTSFLEDAHRTGAQVLFTEPKYFSSDKVKRLGEEMGVPLEVLDPLVEDVLANIAVIARKIAAAF